MAEQVWKWRDRFSDCKDWTPPDTQLIRKRCGILSSGSIQNMLWGTLTDSGVASKSEPALSLHTNTDNVFKRYVHVCTYIYIYSYMCIYMYM